MRVGSSVASLALAATMALAQSGAKAGADTGSIRGTVFSSDDKSVEGAPVQARDPETGAKFRTYSDARGAYALAGIPPGSYTISVNMPGFTYLPFAREGVAVAAVSAAFDIHLAEGPAAGTLGDDPGLIATIIRKRTPPRSGPTPLMPDGHPDLSGVWNGNDDPFPEDPPYLPAAAAWSRKAVEENFKNDPYTRCIPADALLFGSATWRLVQTPTLLVTVVEGPPFARQVYLDGRGHPDINNPLYNPTWMGHSVGRWEGDTLVVDTIGFNDRGYVGGASNPRSEKLHVVERYRRPDFAHLEIEFTIDDPVNYAQPWKIHNTWDLAPKGEEVLEYICAENNKDVQHLVGK